MICSHCSRKVEVVSSAADWPVLCYECCAFYEALSMLANGSLTLYLSGEKGRERVTNWPGTLTFPVFGRVRISKAFGRVPRQDVWFIFAGHVWHMRVQGNMQCGQARKTKKRYPLGETFFGHLESAAP